MKRIKTLTAILAVAIVFIGSAFTMKSVNPEYPLYDIQANGSNYDLILIDENALEDGEFVECVETDDISCRVEITSGSYTPVDQPGPFMKIQNIPLNNFAERGISDRHSTVGVE